MTWNSPSLQAPRYQLSDEGQQRTIKSSLVSRRLDGAIRKAGAPQNCPSVDCQQRGWKQNQALSLSDLSHLLVLTFPAVFQILNGLCQDGWSPLSFINCCPSVVGYPVFLIRMRIFDSSQQHRDMQLSRINSCHSYTNTKEQNYGSGGSCSALILKSIQKRKLNLWGFYRDCNLVSHGVFPTRCNCSFLFIF